MPAIYSKVQTVGMWIVEGKLQERTRITNNNSHTYGK